MALRKKNARSIEIEPHSSVRDEGDSPTVYLRRQINLIDAIALIVGIVIGSGIFIFPSGVLRYTGSVGWALIMWAISGVFAIFGGLCYAELGTTFQKSGGSYYFLMKAYGPQVSFLVIYAEIIAFSTGSAAIQATSFAHYVLLPMYPDCDIPYAVFKIFAASIICKNKITNRY